MNERLKQIAIKAQVEHCVSHVRLQEFADLIIKECMTVCEDVAERNDPAIACYYEIKQHFGVDL
jgi:hypothetical protein